jgi:putative transposase
VSERRACRVVGLARSTQRRTKARSRRGEEERRLVAALLDLVRRHQRYGYRRIWALLAADGWVVNVKRVHRLWRANGLRVPTKSRKKRRLGSSENACHRKRAVGKDHVWTWDFIHDRTADGRPLKWLSVVDEYTRECLALEVGRGLTAGRVIGVLERLFADRGLPGHVRSDNGPEFIAAAVRRWLAERAVSVLYVAPASPWENGYAESFHGKVRDELLNAEVFGTLTEARVLGSAWRDEYNTVRPHSRLGYQTPAAFAATCVRFDAVSLRQQPIAKVTT